jgi:hypothetical protein
MVSTPPHYSRRDGLNEVQYKGSDPTEGARRRSWQTTELGGAAPVILGHNGAREELLHAHQDTAILLEPNSRWRSSKHNAPACEAPWRRRQAGRVVAFREDEARLVVASRRDMGADLGHAKCKLEGRKEGRARRKRGRRCQRPWQSAHCDASVLACIPW